MTILYIVAIGALFVLGPPLVTLILAVIVGEITNVVRHALANETPRTGGNWPLGVMGHHGAA
ncbi:MAG: hypothetical protein HQL37_10520 [Alphaproteobacteria bacterium]|nr:hypothetical protein [Alphaproteobacteria bacterium]